MAKIHKLFKKGVLLYPLTILQAVFDPESKKNLKEVLADKSGIPEEETLAVALNKLKEEVSSLREFIEEGNYGKNQVDVIDVITEIKMKGSPLFYIQEGAPSFAPDQLPQFYIDTLNKRLYTASGTSSVNDWF